jgi:hypothetical protein
MGSDDRIARPVPQASVAVSAAQRAMQNKHAAAEARRRLLEISTDVSTRRAVMLRIREAMQSRTRSPAVLVEVPQPPDLTASKESDPVNSGRAPLS